MQTNQISGGLPGGGMWEVVGRRGERKVFSLVNTNGQRRQHPPGPGHCGVAVPDIIAKGEGGRANSARRRRVEYAPAAGLRSAMSVFLRVNMDQPAAERRKEPVRWRRAAVTLLP